MSIIYVIIEIENNVVLNKNGGHMRLSKERIGEIAFLSLVSKFKQEGLSIKPKEIRRNASESAKKLGIPLDEFAEFAKILYKELYDANLDELNKLSGTDKVEK
jgi:hypothetical protein